MELYNMPMSMFHYLDCMVIEEMKSEEARQRKANELANDELEAEMTKGR